MNPVIDHVTEEEYLKTIGSSRDEFDNGRMIRRAVTGITHGTWTVAIIEFLLNKGIVPKSEVHVIVRAGDYRIPDVLVLRPDAPREEIVMTPPEAVFEVLSPADPWDDVEAKFQDYEQMGIPIKLLLNPRTKMWKVYSGGEFRLVQTRITLNKVEIDLADIEQYVRN